MKQLIVLAAVLPLLLLFVLQFSIQEQRHYQMARAEEITAAACEQAKLDGCFTTEKKEALRRELATVFGEPADAVEIKSTDEIRYRANEPAERRERGMIEYEIRVPVSRLMAGNRLLGITDEENRGVYTMQGRLASERLMP